MTSVASAPSDASANGQARNPHETADPETVAQVRAARSRSNSWFTQVKQREARLQAAEDKVLDKEAAKKEKVETKKESKDAKKSGFFGNALRRLSSTSRKDRHDSLSTVATNTSQTSGTQPLRLTLNKNAKRKRSDVTELKDSSLRRVCFQLDALVELRTYEQVEADDPRLLDSNKPIPTVRDMKIIDPYASSTPLDRAILYTQCCKVYRTEPHPEIVKQFSSRGPARATYEGPRSLEVRNIKLTYSGAMALADCLGLPLTGKHLTEIIFDNCALSDATFQLLLSSLYSSSSETLERLEIINNPEVTSLSLKRGLCFLCLSPQIIKYSCSGAAFDIECARLMTRILSDGKIRAIRELGLSDHQLPESELQLLLSATRRAGVQAYHLQQTTVSSKTMEILTSQSMGFTSPIYMLQLASCRMQTACEALVESLTTRNPILSLDISSTDLSLGQITAILRKTTMLPNFRRLDLSGHDLRTLVSVLRETLPRMSILRRLRLSGTMLESSDIISLCDVLSTAKLSELTLTGIKLDSAALSALYALARVSGSLVNLEIDIPGDPHSEELSRKILGECIQNMETREANVDLIETDAHDSIFAQRRELEERAQPLTRHEELGEGGEGVASALVLHLDTTDDELAKDVPLEMLERAKHIRDNIEPALSEPLSDLQYRRLLLVSETLEKVIARFEDKYPEWQQKDTFLPEGEVYEHTGKLRAPDVPARGNNNSGFKSRQLEAEEGEMMKLSHKMSDRLHILQSQSASPSRGPSQAPSRGELEDQREAEMLQKMYSADGDDLKKRLYELQHGALDHRRSLGQEIA